MRRSNTRKGAEVNRSKITHLEALMLIHAECTFNGQPLPLVSTDRILKIIQDAVLQKYEPIGGIEPSKLGIQLAGDPAQYIGEKQ